MPKQRVLLGMSGGVDSSVSAVLLLENGFEVIGGFMKNWSGDVEGPACPNPTKVGAEFAECGWREERRDALRVASKLGIPFQTFDFEAEYRRDVVSYLFREYEAGRTPNPDVMCNRYVKFDLFVKEADQLGCQFIATGHYAKTEIRPEGTVLLAGTDPNKDQTYFLWAMPKAVLPRVLFPVGDMLKPQVREKATQAGLTVAKKKDSTGMCFVGEVDMRAFLQAKIEKHPGPIVNLEGKTVGTHEGLAFYTIGQRHGLEVGGGTPYYVVEKHPDTNTLVVASNFHPALFKKELIAFDCNWLYPTWEKNQIPTSFRCQARIRYRQPLAACEVKALPNNQVAVTFDEPQRAMTPGQSIVFYQADVVLGGAMIL